VSLDWSAAGAAARRSTHEPLLRLVDASYPAAVARERVRERKNCGGSSGAQGREGGCERQGWGRGVVLVIAMC